MQPGGGAFEPPDRREDRVARLSLGQKAARVLQLFMGLRNRRVAAALKQYGFSEADLEQGWSRLRALTTNRLGVTIANDPQLVQDLDEWENRWFPVADVVLRANAPEVHAMVFQNLSQTEGPEVIVSVSTFIERVDQISKSKDEGGFGAAGKKARELLEKRGLTKDTVKQARALLDKAGKIAPPTENDTDEDDEQLEIDLWNWYLEWGGIARVAVKDRRLLRGLGFLRPGSSPGEEPTDPGLEPVEPAPAPSPAPGPGPGEPTPA